MRTSKVPRDSRSSSTEPAAPVEPAGLTASQLGRLAAALLACVVPVLVDPGAVERVAGLHALAATPGPYFVLPHAALLYLWMPLVVLSGAVLVLAPGLLAALALGAGRSVGEWILSGLALSLVVVSAAAAIVQGILGSPLFGRAFAGVVIACAAFLAVALVLLLRRGARLAWPLAQPGAPGMLLLIAAVPAVFLALLVPKLFWEDFNGDGLHSFQAARVLLSSPVPFLSSSEAFATYPGVRTALTSYPQAWFIRLFGESEASVRLPYLLFLAGLFAALLAAIEHRRASRVRMVEGALLWAGVLVYAVVMAYSATYNPYHADIALPATQDTLLLALFLGFAAAHARGDLGWACLHLVLVYTCSPAGVMLVALWLVANALLVRPVSWRGLLVPALVLAVCFVAERAAPAALRAVGLPPPGSEHGLGTLAATLTKLRLPSLRRIAFLVVPSGIVPAAALALWWRQDRIGRTYAAVAIGSFAFFSIQQKNSLHYYAPAMILPLVTLWRLDVWGQERWRRPAFATVAAGALLALSLSWPKELSAYSYARLVGGAVVDRVEPRGPFDLSGYARARLLNQVVPLPGAPTVPLTSFGEAGAVLYHYRNRDAVFNGGGAPPPAPPGDAVGSSVAAAPAATAAAPAATAAAPAATAAASPSINYVIQAEADPAPEGMERAAVRAGAALYVKDRSVLAAHLSLRPPQPYGSRLYQIPKSSLFAN